MDQVLTIDDSSSDDALEIVEDEDDDDDDDEEDDGEVVSGDTNKDYGMSAPLEFVIESPRSGTKHPFKYKCPFCFKFYTSRSGLTSHKNSVHLRAKPYRCEICNEHFASSAQRVAHIHKTHTEAAKKKQQQQEPVILVMPSSQQNLSPHPKTSTEKVVQQKTILPKRMPEQHQQRPQPIPKSPKLIELFDVKKAKQAISSVHVHAFSRSLPLSSESFECADCNVHFEFHEDLLQHLANHPLLVTPDTDDEDLPSVNEEVSNKCAMCNFVPRSSPDKGDTYRLLQEHTMAVHFKAALPNLKSNEGHYSRRATSSGGRSNDPKATRCSFCFKEFEKNSHLQIHLRYHHQQKTSRPVTSQSWICSACSDVFQSSDLLRDHQLRLCRLAFTCDTCNLKFMQAEQLALHVRNSHPPLPASVVAQFKHTGIAFNFRCQLCGKNFISESLLRSHRNVCPAIVKGSHPCAICDRRFETLLDVERHFKNDHSSQKSTGQWLDCNKCSFSSDSIVIFKDHLKKHLSH